MTDNTENKPFTDLLKLAPSSMPECLKTASLRVNDNLTIAKMIAEEHFGKDNFTTADVICLFRQITKEVKVYE